MNRTPVFKKSDDPRIPDNCIGWFDEQESTLICNSKNEPNQDWECIRITRKGKFVKQSISCSNKQYGNWHEIGADEAAFFILAWGSEMPECLIPHIKNVEL